MAAIQHIGGIPPDPNRSQTDVRRGRIPPIGRPFGEILSEQVRTPDGLRFSAHALERIETRGMNLSSEDMERIGNAVTSADRKGSRESLILLDHHAFVVSVTNRTIITAMGGEDMRSHVFTNIDSAVFG